MIDREHTSLDAARVVSSALSRHLHEEFEAYYARRERRRLSAEARARLSGGLQGERITTPPTDAWIGP
jgi:hypothetical protein